MDINTGKSTLEESKAKMIEKGFDVMPAKHKKKDDDKEDKLLEMEKDKFKEKAKYEKLGKGGKDKDIRAVQKGNDKRRKKPKKGRSSWQYYIHKVLKTVHEDDCTLSAKAMEILDSFANDLFDRISSEAIKLLRFNNKRTLSSLEIQTASRLVLPGELCKHAVQDGAKAVGKYQLTETN